jgi:hypothetical protein
MASDILDKKRWFISNDPNVFLKQLKISKNDILPVSEIEYKYHGPKSSKDSSNDTLKLF